MRIDRPRSTNRLPDDPITRLPDTASKLDPMETSRSGPPIGRGIGPSVVGQLVRDRSLRLAAGIAVAVAIPVSVLFYLQFRSIRDLGQSSGVVLRQLSQETADGLQRSIEDALKAPYINVLLRTPQQQSDPLNLAAIEPTFDQALATMPFVTRFYVWSDVSTEHRGELLAYDRENEGFHADLPEADLVLQRFRELAPQKRAISVFEATIDGRRSYFQAQLRFVFPARDKLTSFAAFRVDAERLRSEFLPALVNEKLKSVEGPTGFPPLSVTLVDDAGRVIFPPGGSIPTVYVDERTFRLVFFDPDLVALSAPEGRTLERWRVRTGYGNQTIPAIIDARARPQRALMAMLARDGRPRCLLRRACRGAGSPGRRAEIEFRIERVSRPEDAAGADPALRRDAGARPAEEHRPGTGVLPHHQQRGAQAHAAHQQPPRLLEDRSGAAQLHEEAGQPDRADARRAGSRSTASSATTSSPSRRASTATSRC